MEDEHVDSKCINELAEVFSTTPASIRSLLRGGVQPEHIYEILEIWQAAVVSYQTMIQGRIVTHYEENLTASELVKLYNMCEGDLDMIVRAIDKAQCSMKFIFHSQTRARRGSFRTALREVLSAGLAGLEEEEESSELDE